jgi:glycosyltransferase involved in cell wall biosynthesis
VKVTVLLPVYNAGPPLDVALASVVDQTFEDYEILVIDDASTDDSLARIRRFEKLSPRIQVISHEKNRGLSTSLNEGLGAARGAYIARMDQDDESLPERLATQAAFLDNNPDCAVVGSFVYHMGATRTVDRLVSLPIAADEIAATLPRYNCMYHPSVMLRRETILALGGYREQFRNAEDYDLWLRVSRSHRLANIPEPLLRYRFSTSGMSLGRKWEQLYFVYLAQAAHGNPDTGLDELERLAKDQLAKTDRQGFLASVMRGTFDELSALHLWRDASRLIWRFRREIGNRRTLAEVRDIGRRYLRTWVTASRPP